MKIKNLITIDNLHSLFLLLLIFSITFLTKLLTYIIILWLISGIVLYIKSNKTRITKFNTGIFFIILYYIIVGISLFYSENKSEAYFDIEVKLSLFIVPLMLFLLKKNYESKNNFFLLTFAIANVIATLICIIIALKNSISFSDGFTFNDTVPGIYEDTNTSPPSYFFYSNFSIFKHPAYFSAYLTLSFFIFIHLLKEKFYILKNKQLSYFIYYFSLILIPISIFFLQSKAGYIIFYILIIIYFITLSIKSNKIWHSIIIPITIILIALYTYTTNSRFYYIKNALKQKEDFIKAIKNKNHQYLIEHFGIDRVSLWLITTEIAKEHLIIGCGAGDVHNELNKKFKEYQLNNFVEKHYNTHNQFLETLLAQGIIGLIILLCWLFYPFFKRHYYTAKNYLLLIFLTILIINFMFESMLNSISGVIFTAFFYGFFIKNE